MNYLSHYTEQAQTDLFNKTGAFFAFSNNQFNEAKKDDTTKYVSMGAGLVCPKKNALMLHKGLTAISKAGIELDMKENGPKAIIWRELGNHEAQITMDISDTVDALAGYPITEGDVQDQWTAYFDKCVENDYF